MAKTPTEVILDRIRIAVAKNVTSQEGEVLAYTQTFQRIPFAGPRKQFVETAPFVTKILARSTGFVLVPEWRTTTGDIHYHGVIVVKDRVKWFKSTRGTLKTQGFMLLKKVDDMERWIQYIAKQAADAEQITGLTMPIDDVVIKTQRAP